MGKGTEAESLGVLGSQVSLSGDGQIAAIGYDTVVSLYGISLGRPDSAGTTAEVKVAAPAEQENAKQDGDEAASTTVNICIPFPNATSDDGPLGFIDDLPQAKEGRSSIPSPCRFQRMALLLPSASIILMEEIVASCEHLPGFAKREGTFDLDSTKNDSSVNHDI